MNLRLSTNVRLALLGAAAVLVQLVVISRITILGTRADLLPLLIVAVAVLAGPVTGCIFAFGCGIFVDVAIFGTVGVTAFTLSIVGFAIGRLSELYDMKKSFALALMAGLGTAIYLILYAAIQFSLGTTAPVSLGMLWSLVTIVAINACLAPMVFGLVRQVTRIGINRFGAASQRSYIAAAVVANLPARRRRKRTRA